MAKYLSVLCEIWEIFIGNLYYSSKSSRNSSRTRQKVLLIDLDPQANATSWYGIKNADRQLLNIFVDNGNVLDIIHNTDIGNIDIISDEVRAETIFKWKLVFIT